ncbi:MAG: hypothetical protein WC683_15520 [bacterium]
MGGVLILGFLVFRLIPTGAIFCTVARDLTLVGFFAAGFLDVVIGSSTKGFNILPFEIIDEQKPCLDISTD